MKKERKRLKSIYNGMRLRCYNENNVNYKYYGGKGVTICDEWLLSFENFFDWAINNGYNENLTIDRIDSEKEYSPDNCKWSTKKEQAYNRSISVKLTLNGRTMYMTEWAEELEIDKKILSWRYNNGWSDEEILSRPRDYKESKLSLNGKTHSMSEWSRITGIKVATISYRIKKGWSVEDTLTKSSNDREIKITYNNKTKTLKEWAEYLDIPKLRLNNRRNKGWSDEEIIIGKRRN
ncbi:MAG: hypothetical protein L0I79_04620 [Atopostipes sp.]|nr:hypothetical protein [Atopostipes sp.]